MNVELHLLHFHKHNLTNRGKDKVGGRVQLYLRKLLTSSVLNSDFLHILFGRKKESFMLTKIVIDIYDSNKDILLK